MYGRNKAVGGGMRGTSGSPRAGQSGKKKSMKPRVMPPPPMTLRSTGMKHGGLYHQDEDVAMASKPRMGKAMGGQPSYGSGEMPKAMPN